MFFYHKKGHFLILNFKTIETLKLNSTIINAIKCYIYKTRNMKLLNKNNIIKNHVNTIEQYKVSNYLKDTFNTNAIAIYLVNRCTRYK